MSIIKIGFGGGCHWCTEAVFQSLIGVEKVQQGWIASEGNNDTFSEAVIVEYSPELIPLQTLIDVHLLTHKSTVEHSMRDKYRSAIYTFSEDQKPLILNMIHKIQETFENKIITKVLPFKEFRASREAIQNYYIKNPEKPFCKTYIDPKLKMLLTQFRKNVDLEVVSHLSNKII